MSKLIAILLFIAVIALAASPSAIKSLGSLANHIARTRASLDY